jgi:hypothetical protein
VEPAIESRIEHEKPGLIFAMLRAEAISKELLYTAKIMVLRKLMKTINSNG